jgi:hypothetical protein
VATWRYTNSRATTVMISFSGIVGGSGALLQPGQTLVFNALGGDGMLVMEPAPDLLGQPLAQGRVQELAEPNQPGQ